MPSDTFSPYANAISGIESGGNYAAMGPETKSGDRAHGKYQIMGANIGPWSKEVLGETVTPEQFLANPQLQDAIFQGKFGQYVEKYGPEGAAKAWFAGERGMNNPDAKDSLGTTVSGYGARFMKALGPQTAPDSAQPSPIAPQVVSGAVSAPAMSAYGWSPNNAQASAPAAPTPEMAIPQMAQAPQLQPLGAQRPPPNIALLQAFLQQHAPASPALRFLRTS